MSDYWDEFLMRVRLALVAFDWRRTTEICDEGIDRVQSENVPLSAERAESVLRLLRRKRQFLSMERLGDAIIQAGQRNAIVRAQYAQALIDQGRLAAARSILSDIVDHEPEGSEGNALALGLIGRVHKQQYVSTRSPRPTRMAGVLTAAAEAYDRAYRAKRRPWHGINVVALTARAKRDGIALDGFREPAELAKEILDLLCDRGDEHLSSFDLAAGAEAWLALGNSGNAVLWIGKYLERDDTDAFEVSSTYRQLMEVWELTDREEPGNIILPVLRKGLMERPGACIELVPAEIRAALGAEGLDRTFEKVFGESGPRALVWYRTMLERATVVGRVELLGEPGRGIGTGVLVDPREVFPLAPGAFAEGELLFLTNSHVISNEDIEAIPPSNARLNFEVLQHKEPVRVEKVLWESPRRELDAALLRMNPPVIAAKPYELTPRELPPVFRSTSKQQVYVIGHPLGGPLSASLEDSLQVGWKEPRLHYRTPTREGNSGSPVFDAQWRLLALHHRGSERMDRLDGIQGTYSANEGIWIHAIFEQARNEANKEGDLQ